MKDSVRVFAPATCGNVCVGYDIMGLCYSGVGDTVEVSISKDKKVMIETIKGCDELSTDPTKNTAGVVLLELIEKENLNHGFNLKIEKGIALGSGMGGSAASAVGALVGANELLEFKLSKEKLLKYSLKGEELACGHGHADNSAPCLYGGLVLLSHGKVLNLPFPKEIILLLIHPHLSVKTEEARKVLKPHYLLSEYVHQSQHLAGFIHACHTDDKELIKDSFFDILVEPLRAGLTEGFEECQKLARSSGALGYALSGSGPSQIALCENEGQAKKLSEEIEKLYTIKGIKVDTYIGPLNSVGAEIL